MVFSSVTFIFLFLPVVLAIYYLLFLPVGLGLAPRFWRQVGNLFLLLVSLVFYYWGEQSLVWVLGGSILVNYVLALLIAGGWSAAEVPQLEVGGPRALRQKLALGAAICANLALLGFFKYFNFGVHNYNAILGSVGLGGRQWHDAMKVALPIGISFYTFHLMSYTIDVFRGRVRATRNLIDLGCYVTMFPQLVAGPIVRYVDVAQQIQGRTVSLDRFASGVQRFVFGLAKKVLIANTVAAAADKIFAMPSADLTFGLAWLGALTYTVQIYFDFSGYSDMAIGLGRMFGFEFLENFNYPYIAQSIQDFWRRWHISLSTWFRDYLYIPLGGSRCSVARTYFNLGLVFFLCGLWHGASWTFVAWGLFHGAFLVLERMGMSDLLEKCPRPGRHLFTLLVVIVGWVLFRAESFSQALAMLQGMAGLAPGSGMEFNVERYLSNDVLWALLIGGLFSTPLYPWALTRWQQAISGQGRLGRAGLHLAGYGLRIATLVCAFSLCAMWLASGTYNPFIYFRF